MLLCAIEMLVLCAVASATSSASEVFFAPYDNSTASPFGTSFNALQSDLALIKTVGNAAPGFLASAPGNGSVPDNVIRYCVYNLLDDDYIAHLIEAHKNGATVQVLMDSKNLQEKYVSTYAQFKDAGMSVTPSPSDNQKTPEVAANLANDPYYYNLVGIHESGIMHMKLRYYRWVNQARSQETGTQANAPPFTPNVKVLTGSFNPEDTAQSNDDTLLAIQDEGAVERYYNSFATVLGLPGAFLPNTYDPSLAINVLFSQPKIDMSRPAREQLARSTILRLVRNEMESILLSVYSLRNLWDGEKGGTLVDELCAAKTRGVAIAVVTDKGQADGESGFAGGDDTLTPLRLWKDCGIPVYKAKNYNGKYTAMHHKNALFGTCSSKSSRCIVWTDTANWSRASMGNNTEVSTEPSTTKPPNVETSLVVDSQKADGGVTGLRFLSNFLKLLRTYDYQQACPYKHKSTIEKANCASGQKWGQPDWLQQNATVVTAQLNEAANSTWPAVLTHFQGSFESLSVVINGVTKKTLSKAEASAGVPLPFGSILTMDGTDGTYVVDPAFNWNQEPPVRGHDDALSAQLKVTIAVN